MKTDPVRGEQDEKILRLRIAGLSLRAIAQQVGLSHQGVSDRITAAIAELVHPAAEEYRTLEALRLDHYLSRLASRIYEGDEKAVNAAVRIGERRAKLLGLDSPVQLDVALERRLQEESEVVVDVLVTVLPAVLEAAGLDPVRRDALQTYAMATAQWALAGREGAQPAPPAAPVAVEPVAPDRLEQQFRALFEGDGVDVDQLLAEVDAEVDAEDDDDE